MICSSYLFNTYLVSSYLYGISTTLFLTTNKRHHVDLVIHVGEPAIPTSVLPSFPIQLRDIGQEQHQYVWEMETGSSVTGI